MNAALLEPMIGRRKSVRSISPSPLSGDILAKVLEASRTAIPLFPEIRTSVRILSRDEIKPLGSIFAPYYLALYSETGPDAQLNAGFMLQQAGLYLSAIGIGSCWLGMTRPVQAESDGLVFVIMIAFGTAQEAVYRDSSAQFKRKDLGDIATSSVLPAYINAVRLAPSAINKQPWFFSGDDRSCNAFSVRGRGLINIAEGWRFVDLGICLSHLYIAATADGKTVSFRREDSIPSGSGSEYVLSCRID